MICRLLVFFYLMTSFCYLNAQAKLEIGDWQNHLNYRYSSYVTQNTDEVYVSTGKSILVIDKKDFSYSHLSKIDGLAETKIKLIKYDQYHNKLLVIYESGGIDIISSDDIQFISAIKDNDNIVGSKSINDVHIANNALCYFATAFGIIEFDITKEEFRSTTFTNFAVNAVSSDQAYIYAATENGLYRTAQNNFNKENFSSWTLMSTSFGLPASYVCKNVEVFDNRIFTVINNNLYYLNDNKFIKLTINLESNFDIEWLSAEGKYLILGLKDDLYSSYTKFINTNLEVANGGAGCINRTIYGIEDQYGKIWYADEWRQIRYTNTPFEACNRLEFDSPFSYESSHIETGLDKVYFASGGATENYQIDYNRAGIYILNQDQTWTNINEENTPEIKEKQFLAFNTIAIHPTNPDLIYAGSYLNGVMEYNQASKAFKFFGEQDNNGIIKSSLQSIVGAPGQVRVTNMAFDKNENLWIANYGAPKPISVLTKEGTWHSYSITGNTLLTKMAIDQSGYKWFSTFGAGPSVLVFDDNNTPADPSDDRSKVLNTSNSIISNAQVNCVAVDLDGDVWVGTARGPIIFECNPFEKECIGTQRKVLQDSIAALLLETEEIFCIEVDGANRKWFGTRNGIFVQSPDGETQIYNFTEANSPLLNNKIIDLDFDGNTGLMYISSESGIQSYKTNTTTGAKRNTESAYAFPNPVKPDYKGEIAIKGLARDSDVRITDINGKLIFKTKAFGGQAIWDGTDYSSGNRVDTGVYLVFAASEQDPTVKDVVVTKIAIIK